MNTTSDLAGYVPGDQLIIDDYELTISEHGHIDYYLGYREGREMFSISGAPRSGVKPTERRFVSVEKGCLTLSSFLNARTRYRVYDEYRVVLPVGSNNYFGVSHRISGEEEPALTRAIFGATFADLRKLITAFVQVVDGPGQNWSRYPSITFSKQRDNVCDLTDALIPKWFPYIAFTESTYFKGHVSLYGFYLQLAFLCDRSKEIGTMPGNQFYHELIAAGVDAEALDYILDASPIIHHPLRMND